jgi:hypothetical protein
MEYDIEKLKGVNIAYLSVSSGKAEVKRQHTDFDNFENSYGIKFQERYSQQGISRGEKKNNKYCRINFDKLHELKEKYNQPINVFWISCDRLGNTDSWESNSSSK